MTDVPRDQNAPAQPDRRHEFAERYPDMVKRVITFLRLHSTSLKTEEVKAIADEVIEVTWKHWEHVRAMDQPISWVLKVARHRMIDHGKSTRALPKEVADDDAVISARRYVDPETRLELMETLEDMLELPPHLRDALILVSWYGFSTGEIAETMSVKPDTVTGYLSDARRELKRIRNRPRRRYRRRGHVGRATLPDPRSHQEPTPDQPGKKEQ